MEWRTCSFSNKKSKQQNKSKTKWTHWTIYFKRSYEGDIQQLNQEFTTEYNSTFTKQAKVYLKVHKPSAIVRLAKKDIENQLEDTCVERHVDHAIIVIGFFIKFHYYQILR